MNIQRAPSMFWIITPKNRGHEGGWEKCCGKKELEERNWWWVSSKNYIHSWNSQTILKIFRSFHRVMHYIFVQTKMVVRNRSHENKERRILLNEKSKGNPIDRYSARIFLDLRWLNIKCWLSVLKFCFDLVIHYRQTPSYCSGAVFFLNLLSIIRRQFWRFIIVLNIEHE